MTDATYQPKVYRKSGGDEQVVASGGVITVESGGIIEINTGADLTVNGVSLIDEVAALSGLDSGELGVLNGVTAGTTAPSKAVVLDAAESLAWATTDATASETCTLTITDTRTGAGATGWAAKFDLESNVALGAYANGLYGIINFGASGKVTGLAAGVVGEITLSAGTTDGTYAAIEAEFNVPTGASLGTNSSLMYLSVNGADAATFDTGGYLFTLAGVTAGDTKVFDATMSIGNVDEITHGLKVRVAGADYYLLMATAANAAD